MTTLNETRINSHTLKTSERNALRRIVRFYRDRTDYSGCTSVRITITKPFDSFVSFSVKTRRSDCGEYSQRGVLTEQRASGSIGPRGGIILYQASNGLSDDTKHVAHMLPARIQ